MAQSSFKYSNGDVTNVWQRGLCIHSGNCAHRLPEVFKSREKSRITPEGSTTEKIIQQVKKCPGRTLSYVIESA